MDYQWILKGVDMMPRTGKCNQEGFQIFCHPSLHCSGDTLWYSQAVDHGASLSPIILLLPLLQPSDHFEQRALGRGCVPVCRPADVLEVLDNTITILWLRTKHCLGLFCSGCLGIQTFQIPWWAEIE